jgi:hypothetical protein
VPGTAVSSRNKYHRYSITSSARASPVGASQQPLRAARR